MDTKELAQFAAQFDPLSAGAALPSIYYIGRKDFAMQDSNGVYRIYDSQHVTTHLLSKGHVRERAGSDPLSEVEEIVHRIRSEHVIQYAGPLGGYAQGLHSFGTEKVLVTEDTILPEPTAGSCETIRALFSGMFGHDPQQLKIFELWIKAGYEDLRKVLPEREISRLRPGQALVLVGPANAGKSLTIGVLATIFGGRTGHPFSYMSGNTRFNGDLTKAFLHVIDDEAASRNPATRQKLGAMLKQAVVTSNHRAEKKYQEAIELPLRMRLVICVNDQPGSLAVLPPIDDSLSDKVTLLFVKKHEMPMPTSTQEEQQLFMDTLKQEVPAYLGYLQSLEVPPDLCSSRFGVKEYHHPHLLALLAETDSSLELLELINAAFENGTLGSSLKHPPVAGRKRFVGSARELEAALRTAHRDMEVSRLLPFRESLGLELSRLAEKQPHRVCRAKLKNGIQQWTVYSAADDGGV